MAAVILHNVLIHLFSIVKHFRAKLAMVLPSQPLNERLEKVSWGLRVGIMSPKVAAKFSAGDD